MNKMGIDEYNEYCSTHRCKQINCKYNRCNICENRGMNQLKLETCPAYIEIFTQSPKIKINPEVIRDPGTAWW